MKKVLILSLLCLYTSIMCGVNIQLHYCGGKYKSISFFGNGNEKGCCGSKKKSAGCCKNKQALIKVKDIHQSVKTAEINTPPSQVTDIVAIQLLLHVPDAFHFAGASSCYSPPVLYDNPLYVKNRVLII
ncbi:MAG: hypothetical protein JST26_16555 [Bacteroidetes bacterium]|nr:hypothetical protein [Bacteroidota bacterium]